MKNQHSVIEMFMKLKTKELLIYLIIGILVLVISWQTILYFFSTKKMQEFYTSEIIGTITDTSKDFKGFLLIETNNTWYNLSIYGACIKKISVGDKIQKDVNSFTIIIIPKGADENIEYKCFTNKKIENRFRSDISAKKHDF